MTTYHLQIFRELPTVAGLPSYYNNDITIPTKETFELAKKLCQDRTNMAGFWKQTFLPIRPNHLSDLLLPTLMNTVMKVHHTTTHTFTVLSAILWDLATLPLRLITYIPHSLYISKPKDHPFLLLLERQGMDTTPIQESEITVRCFSTTGTQSKGHVYHLHLSQQETPFPTYPPSDFTLDESL